MPKVLIADDDPILLGRMEKVLERYRDRFETLMVQDGREAIAVLERGTVDLLITDIQMPEIDGLEVLAYVRQHHPVIPCIVMTGYHSPDLRRQMPKDLLYFIKKPLDVERLAALMGKVLESRIPRGLMYGISVPSFLKMVQLEGKSCLCAISVPGKPEGLLYFDRGILCDAVCGPLSGEQAVIDMITDEKAAFRFRPLPAKPVTCRIQKDLDQLIHAAMQRNKDNKDLESVDWDEVLDETLFD